MAQKPPPAPSSSSLPRLPGVVAWTECVALGGGRWALTLYFDLPPVPEGTEMAPPSPACLVLERADGIGRPPVALSDLRWAVPGQSLTATLTLTATGMERATPDDRLRLRADLQDLLGPAGATVLFYLPPEPVPAAARTRDIDYLVKDYNAFRSLMLRRLRADQPGWTDASPADPGIMVVEALAYTADYLSLYQDAVGVEAQLATARLRRSLARHARLLGVRLREGCVARGWVRLRVNRGFTLPADTILMAAPGLERVEALESHRWRHALERGHPAFTTLAGLDLEPALNLLSLADGSGVAVARGARHARLSLEPAAVSLLERAAAVGAGGDWTLPGALLGMEAPDGQAHLVRVTGLERLRTPSSGNGILVELAWHPDDALPFPLLAMQDGRRGFAYGNIALCQGGCWEAASLAPVPDEGVYRPALPWTSLVAAPCLPGPGAPVSAASLLAVDVDTARFGLRLTDDLGRDWTITPDLLCSGPDDRHVVAEREEDGTVTLRFGDGVNGRRPAPGTRFAVRGQLANKPSAVIRRDGVGTLVVPAALDEGRLRQDLAGLGNPVPIRAALAPESMEVARRRAARARPLLVTCAQPDDYAAAALSVSGIAEAVALPLALPAGPGVTVHVRAAGSLWVPGPLLDRVRNHLEERRLAGHRLVVVGPKLAPLLVGLEVVARDRMPASLLRAALSAAFASEGDGFFAPDRQAFGRPLYASALVASAMAVPGVAEARVTDLRRRGVPRGHVPAALLPAPGELVLVAGGGEEGGGLDIRIVGGAG